MGQLTLPTSGPVYLDTDVVIYTQSACRFWNRLSDYEPALTSKALMPFTRPRPYHWAALCF
jgi:hypothetical protein